MTSKEFYKSYQADNNLSDLSRELIKETLKYNPVHVLEVGAGTGKNLKLIENTDPSVVVCGLDISFTNNSIAKYKNDQVFIIHGDESHLRHLCNFDVVISCSFLDHVESVCGIIDELKRIANKAVILAETDSTGIGEHYFSHLYNCYGFKPTPFQWTGEDGANYGIWIWEKGPDEVRFARGGIVENKQPFTI